MNRNLLQPLEQQNMVNKLYSVYVLFLYFFFFKGIEVRDIKTHEVWQRIVSTDAASSWQIDFNENLLVGGDETVAGWTFSR
jgi:hypothetical protein